MTTETIAVCPLCGDPHQEVYVYPVGWLSALHWVGQALFTRRHLRKVRRFAWRGVRTETRHTLRYIKLRKWRELKNIFNGYLAEPHHWPEDGSLRRCGSGWTRRRALRSLRRHGYRGET